MKESVKLLLKLMAGINNKGTHNKQPAVQRIEKKSSFKAIFISWWNDWLENNPSFCSVEHLCLLSFFGVHIPAVRIFWGCWLSDRQDFCWCSVLKCCSWECQSSTKNSRNPPSAWYHQTLPKAGFLHTGISNHHKTENPLGLSARGTSTWCHGVLSNSYVQAISWYVTVPHHMVVPWALWVVKSQ